MRAPVVVFIACAAALVGFLAGREVWPGRAPIEGRTVRYEPDVPALPAPAPPPAEPERPAPPAVKAPPPPKKEAAGGSMKIVRQGDTHVAKKHGWWKDKNPMGEGRYVEGRRHGDWRFWHQNGKLLYEGTYNNGRPIGRHREWYGDGRLKTETTYDEQGRRDGPETTWHGPGTPAARTEWRAGKRHGVSTTFDAKGRMVTEGVYRDGALTRPMRINPEHFGEDGDLERKAAVNGKYRGLLARVTIPTDVKSYTRFNDYGFAKTPAYAGYAGLPPGYWVYVYPHWYIWKEKTDG